jgi:hypothetical protein
MGSQDLPSVDSGFHGSQAPTAGSPTAAPPIDNTSLNIDSVLNGRPYNFDSFYNAINEHPSMDSINTTPPEPTPRMKRALPTGEHKQIIRQPKRRRGGIAPRYMTYHRRLQETQEEFQDISERLRGEALVMAMRTGSEAEIQKYQAKEEFKREIEKNYPTNLAGAIARAKEDVDSLFQQNPCKNLLSHLFRRFTAKEMDAMERGTYGDSPEDIWSNRWLRIWENSRTLESEEDSVESLQKQRHELIGFTGEYLVFYFKDFH